MGHLSPVANQAQTADELIDLEEPLQILTNFTSKFQTFVFIDKDFSVL